MRHAFTLIELMIVIAIIAIIAAIAIPNLLESRVTSQESAAVTALRSGLIPAQVQFQSGNYSDADNNGIGAYAVMGASGTTAYPYNVMSGVTQIGGLTLNLLPPTWSVPVGSTGNNAFPLISGYRFKQPGTATLPSLSGVLADNDAERIWGALSFPADDNQGRRFFAINQAGAAFSSKPNPNASTSATPNIGGAVTNVTDAALFGTSLAGSPSSSYYLPFRR